MLGIRLLLERESELDQKRLVILSYLDFPYPAGLSVRLKAVASTLGSSGIRVTVLAPISRGDSGLPRRESNELYEIVRFPLRSGGWSTNTMAARLLFWLQFNLLAFRKILRIRNEAEVVIQYQSIYSFVPALLAKLFLGSKVIGDDIVTPDAVIIAILSRFSDCIVTPSRTVYNRVSAAKKTVIYFPNGVTTIRAKERAGDATEAVFVGSLSFDQNIVAVKNILAMGSDLNRSGIVRVKIVGGPKSLVRHLMDDELVSKGIVEFLGGIGDSELHQVYQSAFIGLLPFFESTPLKGGQRTKALEYFANLLLVISGPEGVAGIEGLKPWEHYLPCSSVETMAALLTDCFENPTKYMDVARRGSLFVEKSYSWNELGANYVDVIRELVS